MNENISVISIVKLAWIDFKKWKFTLFALTLKFIVLSLLAISVCFALALLTNLYALFVSMAFVLALGIIFLYTTIVTKNALDIVYKRHLSGFKIPAGALKVAGAVVFTGFLSSVSKIGISSSNIMIFIVSLALYFLVIYFLLRVSFVEQILLEEQGLITGAFNESWNLTENYFWLLIVSSLIQGLLFSLPLLPVVIFMYGGYGFNIEVPSIMSATYALLLFGCGAFVELYFVYPLCLLIRSHLFKALVESENL